MREHPDRFPAKAVEAMERASEYRRFDPEELERERRLDSPRVDRSTLEAVLELLSAIGVIRPLQSRRNQATQAG